MAPAPTLCCTVDLVHLLAAIHLDLVLWAASVAVGAAAVLVAAAILLPGCTEGASSTSVLALSSALSLGLSWFLSIVPCTSP